MPEVQPPSIELSFFVSDIPDLPNTTKGAHWSKLAKVKKEWTAKVHYLALEAKQRENLKGLYDHANIHFHISVGSNRKVDPDGLIWACTKPAMDGLQGVLIKNDTIDDVSLSFSFDRQKPKGFRVTLSGL
jgi:diadenosine tetraphosphate (Ap4A) HIT family hydrolase